MLIYKIDDIKAYNQPDKRFDLSNISRSRSKVNIDLKNSSDEVFKTYTISDIGKVLCKSMQGACKERSGFLNSM